MHRVIVLAAVAVLAGCSGAGIPPASGETSPTPTHCEEYGRTTVTPVRDDVEPRTVPDRPDTLTADTAGSFAADYERVFKHNGLLTRDTKRADVAIHDVEVTSTDGGYRVNITAQWFTWSATVTDENGTATATPVHRDGPYYDVHYLVTDDRLRRHEPLGRQTPTPPDEWTTVECWT